MMPFKYNDAQRINPQVLGTINTDKSYDLFMNKFIWGGANRGDVYYDEPNRHEFVTYRYDASFLANQLISEGKPDKAVAVLDKVMDSIKEASYSYDLTAYFIASGYYRAGATKKANDLALKLVRNAEDMCNWVSTLSDDNKAIMSDEVKQQFQIMQSLAQNAYQAKDSVFAKRVFDKMQAVGPKVKEQLQSKNGPGPGDEQ
jgi:hypothetical protein